MESAGRLGDAGRVIFERTGGLLLSVKDKNSAQARQAPWPPIHLEHRPVPLQRRLLHTSTPLVLP